jgi:ubiquitin carboxyl-terminal hydrolase 34
LAAIEDGTTSYGDIFTLGKPFKCLYAIYAIKEHSAAQLQQASTINFPWELFAKYLQGIRNDASLSRSVDLIIAAITTRDILESCAGEELKGYLALHLIECLTQLLRGKNISLNPPYWC